MYTSKLRLLTKVLEVANFRFLTLQESDFLHIYQISLLRHITFQILLILLTTSSTSMAH